MLCSGIRSFGEALCALALRSAGSRSPSIGDLTASSLSDSWPCIQVKEWTGSNWEKPAPTTLSNAGYPEVNYSSDTAKSPSEFATILLTGGARQRT
jgi:hypothetical protein